MKTFYFLLPAACSVEDCVDGFFQFPVMVPLMLVMPARSWVPVRASRSAVSWRAFVGPVLCAPLVVLPWLAPWWWGMPPAASVFPGTLGAGCSVVSSWSFSWWGSSPASVPVGFMRAGGTGLPSGSFSTGWFSPGCAMSAFSPAGVVGAPGSVLAVFSSCVCWRIWSVVTSWCFLSGVVGSWSDLCCVDGVTLTSSAFWCGCFPLQMSFVVLVVSFFLVCCYVLCLGVRSFLAKQMGFCGASAWGAWGVLFWLIVCGGCHRRLELSVREASSWWLPSWLGWVLSPRFLL